MSDELNTEAAAEPLPAPVMDEPAAEHVSPAERTMEKVHDELRPPAQPRVKGQFSSTKPQPAPRPDDMPKAWGNDKAAIWATLNPDHKAFISQRENEAQTRLTELGHRAKTADTFAPILERYRDVIGQTPVEQEIEGLLRTKAALMQDKEGTLRQLAQQLGVDLGSPQAPQPDQQRLLQEATQYLDATLQQHHQTQAKQVYDRAAAARAEFIKGKEDHWDELLPEMQQQAQTILASEPGLTPMEILRKSYDRALKLNDNVRTRLDAPKTKAEAEKRAAKERAEIARKASNARRLASLNVGSTSRIGGTPRNHKSIEAELEEVYDRSMRLG